jgi:Mg/Co/Ni transporter MgtE
VNRAGSLTEAFALRDPARVADLLEAAPAEQEAAELLAGLPSEAVAGLLKHLSIGRARLLLTLLDDDALSAWLNDMQRDAGVLLLARLPDERRQRLLRRVRQAARRQYLERGVGFPLHSVGSVVEADIVALQEDLPIAAAIDYLRQHDTDPSAPVVTVGADGQVRGLVDLKQLVSLADDGDPLQACARPVTPLRAEMPISAALERRDWETQLSLPVVDYRDHLLGFVSRSGLADAAADLEPQETAVHALVEVAVRFLEVCGWLTLLLIGGRTDRDAGSQSR